MIEQYYNNSVILFNSGFFLCFTLLLKLVMQEIRVKINQKAVKILQIKHVGRTEDVLVVNLHQLLLVWSLVTLLKLGSFHLFAAQDYLLIGSCVIILKIVHIKRQSLSSDLASVFSLSILIILLNTCHPSDSVLQLLSDLLLKTIILSPVAVIGIIFTIVSVEPVSLIILVLVMLLFRINVRLGFLVSVCCLSSIVITNLELSPAELNKPEEASFNKSLATQFIIPSTETIIKNEIILFHQYIENIKTVEKYQEMKAETATEQVCGEQKEKSNLVEKRQYFVFESSIINKNLCHVEVFDITNFNIIFRKVLRLTWWISQYIPVSLKHKIYQPSLSLQGSSDHCSSLPGQEILTSSTDMISNSSNCVLFNQFNIGTSDEDSVTRKILSMFQHVYQRISDHFF